MKKNAALTALFMALYVALLLWPFGVLFGSMKLGTPLLFNALRLILFCLAGAGIGKFVSPVWRNRVALLSLILLCISNLLIRFVLLLIPVTAQCAVGFYISYRCGQKKFDEAFTPHFFLTGLLLYGMNYISTLVLEPSYLTMLSICCAVFLVTSLLILNRVSLRDAANKGRADKAVKRLLPGNTAMTLGFVLVIVFLVLLKPLSDGISLLVGYLGTLLGYAYKFFSSGTSSLGKPPSDDGSAPDLSQVGDGKHVELPFLERMFEILSDIFLVLVFIAAFAALLYGLYRLVKFLVKGVNNWFNRYAGEGYNSEYTEESEQILTWDKAREEILDRMKENIKKAFRRQPKWEELPDDRTRVRTAYQHALRAQLTLHHDAKNQTPDQLISQMGNLTIDRDHFIDSYNRARYSEHPITKEDAQNAKGAF